MTTNTGTIIIMRMLYPLLWMLCTLTAHAQTQTPDSLVSVRARWCKGDTMRYQYEQAQFQISHRDTLCTDYSCQTMTFVVCDSTDRGYLLEYVPELTASKSPADTARQALRSQFVSELNRLHVRFRTDRNGTVEHIDNWRQLRDSLQACLGRTLDQTYDAGAGALMPRNRLEALLRMEFATEENLRNSLEELDLLFGLHGIAAPVGQQALHPTADYPTEGTITASYGPYRDGRRPDRPCEPPAGREQRRPAAQQHRGVSLFLQRMALHGNAPAEHHIRDGQNHQDETGGMVPPLLDRTIHLPAAGEKHVGRKG